MPIPGNTRPFDHPENRSIISWMTGQGAYRKRTPATPPPRLATIPTNSPMTAPLVSPYPSAVAGDIDMPMPKTFQDLIPGPKNRDFAYANHKPLLSQHLSGAGSYRRSQSSARLQEQLAAMAPARAHVPAAAPPLDQSPVQTARMAPPDPRTAITPQHMNRELFGGSEPSSVPSLAQRLLPRKMAAAQPAVRDAMFKIGRDDAPGETTVRDAMYKIGRDDTPGPQLQLLGQLTQPKSLPRQVSPAPGLAPDTAPATAARPGRTAAEILAAGAKGYVPGPPPPSMNEGKTGLAALPTDVQQAERTAFGMKPGNMTYSGTGRTGNRLIDKLDPARNREEIMARENRGLAGTATLEQAAADPSFNANGAMFGGAKLGVNDSGKAYFREGDKPTRFAGGAKTPEEARARYIAGLVKMQNEGVGSIDMNSKALVGAGSSAQTPQQVASRLKAGGTTPTTLTPEQLEANKQSMLARMGARREQAQGMRMENQRQEAIARANQPSPLLQRMMQENPELAVRIMEGQQRGQIAQGQLGLQGREIEQRGELAKDQLAAQGQQAKDQMTLQEKLALARQQHEAGLQANNPEIAIRKQQIEQQGKFGADQLAQQGKIAADQLAQQKAIADMENQVAQEKIKAAERGAGAEGQAKIQQGIVGAVLADETIPLPERLQAAQQLAGQGGQAVAPPAGAQNPLLDRLGGPKAFAGGTLNENQHKQMLDLIGQDASPNAIAAKLKGFGLRDDQITRALNELMPASGIVAFTNFIGDVTGLAPGMIGTRSHDDPDGTRNMLRARLFKKMGN